MFHKNYINSINQGLIETEFKISGKSVESLLFFDSINNILNSIKQYKNRIFFFGNGASASFANHMALDFSKNGKVLSRSLSDNALITALSNDYSYEEAMVEFLNIENVSNGDLIVTISSSGNSPNIISVLNYCKENNIKSLALSGLKEDNKSRALADYSIYVPMKTYGMVECIHQVYLHLILDYFMEIEEWNKIESQDMNFKNYKL
jgi:D-sedoheptulose 7-phosphate isomerase